MSSDQNNEKTSEKCPVKKPDPCHGFKKMYFCGKNKYKDLRVHDTVLFMARFDLKTPEDIADPLSFMTMELI